MYKICIKCKVNKSLSEYHNDSSRKDNKSNRCKECRCLYKNKIKKPCVGCGDIMELSGFGKSRKYCSNICYISHSRFNINKYIYNDLYNKYDGKCHICKQVETNIDIRTNKTYRLSIDHCHKDGFVRGLLCSKCNNALGLFNDDVNIIYEAIIYLSKHIK